MLVFRKSLINGTLGKVLKWFHYGPEVWRTYVGWYVANPLSLRNVVVMMRQRGVFVDHSTVHRLAVPMLSILAAVFRTRKRPVGTSWCMDETYIKVAVQWKHLFRSADKSGVNTANQFYRLAV